MIDYEDTSASSGLDSETDRDSDGFSASESEPEVSDWRYEVSQTLQRAFEDKHTADIATLELNTLKMAYNLSFRDLREIVVPGILELCIGKDSDQITQIIERWFPIVKKFVHTADDETDLLNVIVKYLLKCNDLVDQFPVILKNLFDIDLLEEEITLKWHDSLDDAVGQLLEIRQAVLFAN